MSNAMMAQRNASIRQGAPMMGQALKTANTLAEEGPSFDGTSLPTFGNR